MKLKFRLDLIDAKPLNKPVGKLFNMDFYDSNFIKLKIRKNKIKKIINKKGE